MDLINAVRSKDTKNLYIALNTDWDFFTFQKALYFAIKQSNLNIIELMLIAAQRATLNNEDNSLLVLHYHLVEAVYQNDNEIVRLLLKHGALSGAGNFFESHDGQLK